MLNVDHFRRFVIRPTLQGLDMWSDSAENLLLGTALEESTLFNLRQLNGGPALGLYQIEPATHDDIWTHYLSRKEDLASAVTILLTRQPSLHDQLVTNLAYATAIARLIYLRQRPPLPAPDDTAGMADYWKLYYNTPEGAGTPAAFREMFDRYVLGRRP